MAFGVIPKRKAFYSHELVEVFPPYLLEGHKRKEANSINHLASRMRGSEVEIAKSKLSP
jgi:hypothetical protein